MELFIKRMPCGLIGYVKTRKLWYTCITR